MSDAEKTRGWCGKCDYAWPPTPESLASDWLCPRCGGRMKRKNELTRDERSIFAFQAWSDEVWTSGKWGPSPGGAAKELQCDRSMIDKLADRGILEKSIYDKDGHYVVFISSRSVKKAKENKKKRGKWTDSGED